MVEPVQELSAKAESDMNVDTEINAADKRSSNANSLKRDESRSNMTRSNIGA